MPTQVQKVKEQVKSFLTKQFLFEFEEETITSETNLFESGIIDSFGAVELVSFLESKFKIELTDEELVSGSLRSLDSIVKLIKEKNKQC